MANTRRLFARAGVVIGTSAALVLGAVLVGAPASAGDAPLLPPVDVVYLNTDPSGTGTANRVVTTRPIGPGVRSELAVRDFALQAVSPDMTLLAGEPRDGGASGRVRVVRPDGAYPVDFGSGAAMRYEAPEFSSSGTRILMTLRDASIGARLYEAPVDAGRPPGPLFFNSGAFCDFDISASKVGLYAFSRVPRSASGECDPSLDPAVMLYNEQSGAVTPVTEPAADGSPVPVRQKQPDISPDGTRIALTVPAPGHMVGFELFDLASRTRTTVPATRYQPDSLDWSPDGRALAYRDSSGGLVGTVDVATGEINNLGSGANPIWRPVPVSPAVVTQVYGSNAITTGVATSRFKFDAAGSASGARKANVAVLTRSDAFYDGLAGAGLAGAKGGPMLLTPKEGLAPAVSAELARILSPGATVYVLGDEGVVSAAVDTQIRALGLTPKRLAGNTVAETGVAIAKELTMAPKEVFVATAAEYYDALAAGAAAGSTPGATVVFSWGDTLPAATANYLRSLDRTKTKVTAVGGPAVVALNSASIRIDATADGRTAPDTARLLAEHSFARPKAAALATMATWQDALTGGALIAGHGPLLLANATSLPVATLDYLIARKGTGLDRLVVVGGTDVVNEHVGRSAGQTVGTYDLYQYVDSPNGDLRVALP
ncbi:cell wall-binding repeat-containing protein [Embleya sp. NPDC008237]|uniref:cell wall-binding repeat-containing protein n=1 Tax=Embleya sp. NPDC008237 TaxID=3363978 RepID=UPI0036EB4710